MIHKYVARFPVYINAALIIGSGSNMSAAMLFVVSSLGDYYYYVIGTRGGRTITQYRIT